ncbi:hypothetical protein [Vibrio diazotrophicus]|uniref:hypothetical protein n=1 Tax=Vibrio diazotrophicus TaxID=685 RepID=UPI00142D35D9|nr:hypothetical protein [Vibrio diazotrophicus]NIY91984.1 hypothetical protein [Vibrio diazotrophicus]
MNTRIGASLISLLCIFFVGCGDEDKYAGWGDTLSSNNINAFTKQHPSSGGIMNDLTRTKLKMAELKHSGLETDKSIAQIKQTFLDFNYVVLEFDRLKKLEGGSLEANQALLDKISVARSGMSHAELTQAVNVAMKELDKL